MSKARVTERVMHGGHNISIKAIERRFSRSLYNLLNDFSHVVNNCSCFNNTGNKPALIFEQQGKQRTISNEMAFQSLLTKSKL